MKALRVGWGKISMMGQSDIFSQMIFLFLN